MTTGNNANDIQAQLDSLTRSLSAVTMMSHILQQNMTEQEEDESETDNANVESGEEGELTEPEPVKPDIVMTKGKGNTNSLLEILSKNVKSKENVGSSVSDELVNIVNDL